MNNCRNENEDFEKLHHRCRPIFCLDPTGPTARLFKSSNKNNHRSKPNNSLYQKKEVHFYTSISYF